MSTTSPLLQLPFIQPAQAQKHVTHNEALQILDAVVQLRLASFGRAEPPADPGPGDAHAVGPAATGAWDGQDGRLALWDGTGWLFVAPREGWRAWDAGAGELRVLRDGAWRPLAPVLQEVEGVGVNAAFDAVNRLAVSAPATLLSHDGAGHQVKVNKAAATETASLLFQSGFVGHAEMGLAGDNDFAVKVADGGGGAWRDALKVARATGRVSLPQGAVVMGTLTGSAVQAGPTDATAGRLLTTGAYGLGGLLPPIGNAAATDNGIVPGLYSYDAGLGSTGGPAGVSRGSLLHTRRASGGGETQVLVVESGSAGAAAGLVFSRSRVAGAWSAWTCGSILESGSGAQGRWVRHQDGTQTCWHALTASATAETVWTFPAPFASATGLSVSLTVGTGAVALLCPRFSSKTEAQLAFSVINATPAREARAVDLVAVGRWY